jgi:hypothetical protein
MLVPQLTELIGESMVLVREGRARTSPRRGGSHDLETKSASMIGQDLGDLAQPVDV